jgi:hypothetical protein
MLSSLFDLLNESMLTSLATLTASGGLGILFAYLSKWMISRAPAIRRWAILLPWRTLMLAALYIGISNQLYISLDISLFSPLFRAAMTGIAIFALAVPFTTTTILAQWYPLPTSTRLFSLARTLLTISVLIGLRQIIRFGDVHERGIRQLLDGLSPFSQEYKDQAHIISWGIMGLVLFVDLALGIGGFIGQEFSQRQNRTKSSSAIKT